MNQRKEHGRLFRNAGSLCHHLSTWLKGLSKQREGNMNTITINTTNEDGTTQSSISYTEAEVLHFKKRAQETDDLHHSYDNLLKEIRTIKNEVRDFFSEGQWENGETTCSKADVNVLLDSIGTSKITTKYSGNFTITGTFNVEVEEEDEVQSMIEDNMEVSVWGADLDVESVEVHDVEEDD